MALTAGSRLGPFEIIAQIGVGGMGEVYRATDTNLKRQVAIKVLPEALAADTERLARFQREAEVLASLNHLNIAQIYGLEKSGHTTALVMELVEGLTLADRIAEGAISIEDALPIARQIAEALAAAHEQGIIHRDLKPANIKVRPDGAVKVLDFGLAKAMERIGVLSPTISQSPTITTTPPMTQSGLLIGTAAYMSPEQARGKVVDKRADIWAFGCVLYEMVTGRRPFEGNLAETLGRVLMEQPDFSQLPFSVRRAIEKCLEKDPKNRLRDISDFQFLVTTDQSVPAPPRRARTVFAVSGWVIATLILGLTALNAPRGGEAQTDTPNVVLTIVPTPEEPLVPVGDLDSAPEIAPDGSAVLYAGPNALYVRRLDSLKAIRVPGSERYTNHPFWSADSLSVYYPAGDIGRLIKVRLPDGPPEDAVTLPGFSRGGSENGKGAVLLSSVNRLHYIAAAGQKVEVLDVSGVPRGRIEYPEFLPDGSAFLFLLVRDEDSTGEVYLASLQEGRVREPVLLLRNATAARYTPAGSGKILFVRDDKLYSQALDLDGRRLVGDSELVENRVASSPGLAVDHSDFSVSRAGMVAWRPGTAALSQATTFGRDGKSLGLSGPRLSADTLSLSPDETRLLAAGDTTWLLEIGQPGGFHLGFGRWLFWSPDASVLIGMTPDEQGIATRSLSDSGKVTVLGRAGGYVQDMSRDATQLLFSTASSHRIGIQQLDSAGLHASKLLATGAEERVSNPAFSPDGKSIVYRTSSGLFVQPFPGPGLRRQIATDGEARSPRWRGDGREIVYFGSRGGIYSIRVDLVDSRLIFAPPQLLFEGVRWPVGATTASIPLSITRDGSQIYWLQAATQPGSNVIHIRTNAVN